MRRTTILAALVFFLLINLSFLWEWLPGLWDIAISVFLAAFYFGLAFILLLKFIEIATGKFQKSKLADILILSSVLLITAFYPTGFIKNEHFEDEPILIARSEGAANCMTSISFFENNRFTEKNVCFGIDRYRGNYRKENDTIHLIYDRKSSFGLKSTIGVVNMEPVGKWPGKFYLYRKSNDSLPVKMLITYFSKEN